MSERAEETLALRHMRLWLRALNRVLATAVAHQQKQAAQVAATERRSDCITGPHATLLLREAIHHGQQGFPRLARLALLERELEAEQTLLSRARSIRAALPLASLRDEGLTDTELAAVLITTAPEISIAYGRLYGYVVDDLTRAAPTVELLLRLTSGDGAPESTRRSLLGLHARLRRSGLLISETNGGASDLHARLRLGPGVFEWLIGAQGAPPFRLEDPDLLDPKVEGLDLAHDPAAASALACLAHGGVVGVWGQPAEGVGDAVCGLAEAAGRRVYRLPAAGETPLETLAAGMARATHYEAALWIDSDLLSRDASPAHLDGVGAQLSSSSVPILLSGRVPWRPARVLEQGRYAEVEAAQLVAVEANRWPDGADHEREALTHARDWYRFDWGERRAALALARATTNGAGASEFSRALQGACRLVATPAAGRFVDVIDARRSAADLILPSELHRQVLEIATFYARAPQVDARWGFEHMTAGSGGLKVLLTGEAGTGKTLAAEVIAARLGRALLKVDLSQVVSKWVGETEKNLEQVFSHAENSHAVLFFDEADTLFGKRGEIRHGTDRYANLEVGYLLQRLEDFAGLVVLASNLRDEIDPAFTRRFHITLHFPRPGEDERRRLWSLAFARGAPLDPAVDLDELAQLDLTGAGIMGSARLAGLLAATEPSETIRLDHLGEAVSRQFRQQARLLRGRALGALRLEHGAAV